MKLNLGCGYQVVEGWVNVDYALGARFAKLPFFRALNRKLRLFNLDWDERIYLHDLSKKFPWADDSVDMVYSSHTLEHFPKDVGKRFITECHRVLRKGGILRIVIPDLLHFVTEYTEGYIRADDFLEKLSVQYPNSQSGIKDRFAPFFQFRHHKCMYDTPRLIEILSDAGFEVESRAAFDSDISDILLLELEERTQDSVIVEGRKRGN